MSNGWDNAKSEVEKAAANRTFLRLPDGASAVGVPVGDPLLLRKHWTPEGATLCLETEACPHCKAGNRASTRFLMNFYVLPSGEMKVFEGSLELLKSLIVIRDKFGFDRQAVEIRRNGTGLDTKYTVLPDVALDDATRTKVARTPPHDLQQLSGRHGAVAVDAPTGARPTSSATHSPTIDIDTAKQIAETLRALPRGEVDRFLSEFGIARVRDLRVADAARAKAYLNSVVSGREAPTDDIFF